MDVRPIFNATQQQVEATNLADQNRHQGQQSKDEHTQKENPQKHLRTNTSTEQQANVENLELYRQIIDTSRMIELLLKEQVARESTQEMASKNYHRAVKLSRKNRP